MTPAEQVPGVELTESPAGFALKAPTGVRAVTVVRHAP